MPDSWGFLATYIASSKGKENIKPYQLQHELGYGSNIAPGCVMSENVFLPRAILSSLKHVKRQSSAIMFALRLRVHTALDVPPTLFDHFVDTGWHRIDEFLYAV